MVESTYLLVWLYLGSREYRLFDQTLAERKRRTGYPYRSCRTLVPFLGGGIGGWDSPGKRVSTV